MGTSSVSARICCHSGDLNSASPDAYTCVPQTHAPRQHTAPGRTREARTRKTEEERGEEEQERTSTSLSLDMAQRR
eukprot:3748596-Rhodomonas_salina.4